MPDPTLKRWAIFGGPSGTETVCCVVGIRAGPPSEMGREGTAECGGLLAQAAQGSWAAKAAAAELFLSRRDLLRIAQRFNVGWGPPYDLVFSPEGTSESGHLRRSPVSGSSQPSLSGLEVFVYA